jgi:oxygen-independent coproporphyrinogen III oxidase
LPLQTEESIERTFHQIIALKPDRIAFYSYAHVPWTSKSQRLFDENHLPNAEEKLRLYLKGKELLLAHGYANIGMDHFALPHDELYKAWQNGALYRNFMGYTTQNTGLLLGLGVSAISDVGFAFAQNAKALHDYYRVVHSGHLPVKKGYHLTPEDEDFRKYILDISCKGFTEINKAHLPLLKEISFPVLDELVEDGLVEYTDQYVKLTSEGHYFIRNVCSAFDLKLRRSDSLLQSQIFSKAV